MTTQRMLLSAVLACVITGFPARADDNAEAPPEPADLANITANRFETLPNTTPDRPTWIDPVYAADSGTLVGIVQKDRDHEPQTLHFDFETGRWIPQPNPPPQGVITRPGSRRRAAGVYDSTRKRIIYGGEWAYDPARNEWEKLDVSTELYGETLAGAPDVRNSNMVYDPVQDEILLFPYQGGLNWDEWEDTCRFKGHLGTMVFRFEDRVWRRLNPGSETIRSARDDVYALYVRQFKLTERLAILRRDSDAEEMDKARPALAALAAEQAELAGDVRKLAEEFAELEIDDDYEAGQIDDASGALAETAQAMAAAAEVLDGGEVAQAVNRGDLFRALETVRNETLAVAPSPRAESPMVYDPQNRVIVLFGGYVGNQSENDTWIYECERRRWVRRSPEQAPPPRFYHFMYRHPASGLIVMGGGKWAVPGGGGAGTSFRSLNDIWAYDVAEDRWHRVEGTAPQINVGYMYGLHYAHAAYAESRDVLIYTGTGERAKAFRFQPGEPLPPLDLADAVYPRRHDRFPYEQTEQVRRELPEDDADALEKLAGLPANTWVQLPVEGSAPRREWCILSRDVTRGYAVYFGGGHSTHMGDEIDVFTPGSLTWTPSHRASNTQIAPSGGWPNFLPQFSGGPSVTHTRDQYVSMDGVFLLDEDWQIGRVYYGPEWIPEYVQQTNRWRRHYQLGRLSFVFRYDLEGARTWTAHPVPPEVRRLSPIMAFPELGKFGALRQEGENWTWVTVERDTFEFEITPVPGPVPNVIRQEGQHLGALPERNQIMLLGTGRESGVVETWIYDITENEWSRLEPARSIPAPLNRCRAVVYCHDQNAVLASVTLEDDDGSGHWVYSFERNTWIPFRGEQEEGLRVRDHGGPCWSQLVYLPQYRVFVWGAGPALLRPDFDRLDWE